VLGHIINILSHSSGRAVRFCIGPSYGRANTANLEPNILLYCPPTRAIIYTYIAHWVPELNWSSERKRE